VTGAKPRAERRPVTSEVAGSGPSFVFSSLRYYVFAGSKRRPTACSDFAAWCTPSTGGGVWVDGLREAWSALLVNPDLLDPGIHFRLVKVL
jgi:hypothetical protein